MKIIIFTETKVGEGHYQAAKAIKTSLLDADPTIEVKVLSGLRCIHPSIEWITVKSYFQMLKLCPSLWKQLYSKVNNSSQYHRRIFAYRLRSLIEKEAPDIIICTHPTCIQALGSLKQEEKFNFKLGVICTDFDFHPFSISKEVDVYFVAHPNLKKKLIYRFHVEPHKIYSYGIPLRAEYDEIPSSIDERKEKKRHKNDEIEDQRKKILLSGGSTGYGAMIEILSSLVDYQQIYQITVITGNNRSLFHKLTKLKKKRGWDITIIGYEKNMKARLECTDLLITKPGGLTVSEAIACSTPFIMINPIPGHEDANARYLEEHQIGLFEPNIDSLPEKINKLLKDQMHMQKWKERIHSHHRQFASFNIAKVLLQE